MRKALLILLLTLSLLRPAFAQDSDDGMPNVPEVTYPQLASSATSVDGFIPKGWKLENQAIGDLNADARADILFVLRMTDPKNIIANVDGLGERNFDSNPRILAVAFKRDNDFELVLANHTLVRRRTDPVLDDVFGDSGGVEIKGRTVNVVLHLFASAGGWGAGNRTLRFRWQKQAFRLIGWDNLNVHRGSGEVTEVSVNFNTGEVVEGKGTIADDKQNITKRTIPKRPLLTIDEVRDGMEFEPEL